MKSLFKFLFVFFCFFISLLLLPHCEIKGDYVENYIQNNYEKITLISNTINSIEISAQTNNPDNSCGHENEINAWNDLKNISLNKYPCYSQGIIHNISTNLYNEIFTRAP